MRCAEHQTKRSPRWQAENHKMLGRKSVQGPTNGDFGLKNGRGGLSSAPPQAMRFIRRHLRRSEARCGQLGRSLLEPHRKQNLYANPYEQRITYTQHRLRRPRPENVQPMRKKLFPRAGIGRILTLPPQSIGARAVPARSGCNAEWRFGIFGEPPVWRGRCGWRPSALPGALSRWACGQLKNRRFTRV